MGICFCQILLFHFDVLCNQQAVAALCDTWLMEPLNNLSLIDLFAEVYTI